MLTLLRMKSTSFTTPLMPRKMQRKNMGLPGWRLTKRNNSMFSSTELAKTKPPKGMPRSRKRPMNAANAGMVAKSPTDSSS